MHGKNQKNIIVTAEAEGTPVADTTKGKLKELVAKKEKLADLAKEWENEKVPGKPAEVTLPTLSIFSVTDIGTAKVYRDTLTTTDGKTGVENIKDSLISKIDSNKNGAKITSVKVTYIDEKGKKIEDKSGEITVNNKFEKTYQVAAGKTIIVTAIAEGTAVGDTLLGKKPADVKGKGTTAATKELEKDYEKSYHEKVAGKPSEVTLPTLSIN